MPVKEDHRCAVCVKRHEVASQVLVEALGIRSPERLECRALPPLQDVAHQAVYPTVAPDHYCHVYFELDAEAPKAQRAAAKSTLALDAKVAATQARALMAEVAAPLLDDAGQPVSPPAGDLAADLAAPNQPRLALGADDAPPPRARRARGAAKA